MGEHLGVPKEILEKAPSAGLWAGQTAEGEIGVKYEDIDAILYHLLEKRYSPEEIIKKCGMTRGDVEKIVKMVKNSEHKRQTARYPKIGPREINWDYRYPVERN
jgi:NAD+ synthase